jgi:hypothetical protein
MDTARRSPGRPPVRAACAVLAVAGIEDLKTTPASTTMGLGQNFAGHWTPGVKLQVPQMSHLRVGGHPTTPRSRHNPQFNGVIVRASSPQAGGRDRTPPASPDSSRARGRIRPAVRHLKIAFRLVGRHAQRAVGLTEALQLHCEVARLLLVLIRLYMRLGRVDRVCSLAQEAQAVL